MTDAAGRADRADLAGALANPECPRSGAYDPHWVLANLMGPNVLWLTEALTDVLPLRPEMRVLDLGCGRAVSSVFLAREFEVQVWAADLWVKPTDNWARVREAGLADRVFPVHAEAHALPFAESFFDALVSMDAYHYFGTDDLYLPTCARLVRPGGWLGIVVPGLRRELGAAALPPHLADAWHPEYWSFHSPAWWRSHWDRTGAGLVAVERADLLPRGWEHWLTWLEVCGRFGYPTDEAMAGALRADRGDNLGFTRVVARRPE
jgi:SAM-dependent methyltransferase